MMRRIGCFLRQQQQIGPKRYPLHRHDSFLSVPNAGYLDNAAPDFFPPTTATSTRDQPLLTSEIRVVNSTRTSSSMVPVSSGVDDGALKTHSDAARLAWMCRAWEVRGHITSKVDPLNLHNGMLRLPEISGIQEQELEPAFFGFTEADLDREFRLGFSDNVGGLMGSGSPTMTLRALHEKLRRIYGGNIGYEFMHIADAKRTSWLRDRIETPERLGNVEENPFYATKEQKWQILDGLARGELFEKFLHTKFVGNKRFGLDGGESLIPGMLQMLERAAYRGIENIVIGMPHRGRLSVLTNVCGKSMHALFKEFQGLSKDDVEGSGDVKYHLGATSSRKLYSGKEINIALMANPSHLEAVNPLVEGNVRAKQFYLGDTHGEKVLAVQIHGDAAFAGQGVCFETMGFCGLESYKTGGTIHIVVNNQIGFTTDPKKSRSSPYCTDLGRVFGCPIFHVNGDHPEDVARVFRLAVDWRKQFKSSVIVDLVCYRRFGHNETDEPMFTQPLMYRAIKNHPTILTSYTQRLIAEGTTTPEAVEALKNGINDELKTALKEADHYQYKKTDWLSSVWKGFGKPSASLENPSTALTPTLYAQLAQNVCTIPDRIKLHPTLKRVIDHRRQCLTQGKDLDWGAAEALAFGRLLKDNIHVRVSGQDVERGTFSHRHAVVHDQTTDSLYIALNNMEGTPGKLVISNSHLSEYGVLGFELGYSLENPHALVIWEAQFGDFANTAQIIFDQFISSGEAKWGRQSGIFVNLPHGYDGAGPEHSSGRIERFLQMVDEAEDVTTYNDASHRRINMEVCYPSTPANYFHLLSRQVMRQGYRKPTISFFSKAFLRAPNVSTMSDFVGDSQFLPIIPEAVNTDAQTVRRLIFCTGQISHYLIKAVRDQARADIAVCRMEQLAPYPVTFINAEMAKFPNAEVVWVQEEPKNMGAWGHIQPRLDLWLAQQQRALVAYIGRPICASVATGHKKQHDREHKALIDEAVTLFKA